MPSHVCALAALALALVLGPALPAAADAAPSRLSLGGGGALVVTADGPAVSISALRTEDPSCDGGGLCLDDFVIASPQAFVESPENIVSCTQAPDAFAFRCQNPRPSRVVATLTDGADDLVSNGSGPAASCNAMPITVSALAGADLIDGGCGGDVLLGGDGADRLVGAGGSDQLRGEAGDDDVGGGEGDDQLDGGSGDDGLVAGSGGDALAGGAGQDLLTGGAGNDQLDGGEDRDTLAGDDGNDVLAGGGDRDLLVPGLGQDVINGGDDLDTISYRARLGGVTVVLGGSFGNGEAGENDTIGPVVEDAAGGAGADQLFGDGRPNDFDGGAGADRIEPGAGADFVDGGEGDDVVVARDGAQDRVDCGSGVDRAVVDTFDTVVACETVAASRELMADVDNDGIPAPVDCDDHDALRRAGFPDRPGNGRDEDCSGADAPFPRVLTGISTGYRLTAKRTRFTRLIALDVPPEATVQLRCAGGRRRGCFAGIRRKSVPAGAAEVSLTALVRKQRLRPKAVLDVRVLRPEAIGKVVRYTIRGKRLNPKSKLLCLRPGATSPAACP